MRKVLIILVILAGFSSGERDLTPLVEVEEGVVGGHVWKSREGREYLAFLQIPYGNAKRFEPPTKADKWEGILRHEERGECCAQSFWTNDVQEGTEDCLNLQVYTPNIKGNYPVLVFFHGGGFTVGCGNLFHEKYFMDEDVVLVTVNYRLGPFGFLSTGDDVIPGNYGLKDQSRALKWVQRNIQKFGGNPESVGIFGNSAGGASVNYHILSSSSAGTFHAAISQSGSALNPWAFSVYPKTMATRFGEILQCPTKSSRGLLNCLKGKSTKEILDGMRHVKEWGYDPFTPFGPVVEPNIPGAFLTEDPALLLRTGKFSRVPWISGLNEDEGHMMHSAYVLAKDDLREDLKVNWKKAFPITLQFNEVYTNLTPAAQGHLSDKIYDYYFQGKPIDFGTRQELTDVYSDRNFNVGVREAMLYAAKFTSVYPYLFTHNRGDYSLLRVMDVDGNFGVSHADELTFLFDDFYGEAPEFTKGSASEQVSKNLVKLWVSMARDKKPSAVWGSQKIWDPIGEAEMAGEKPIGYYRLDAATEIIPEHFTKRAHFWEESLAEAFAESKSSIPNEEL